MLGTSTTQIRAMALRGDLHYQIQARPQRQRWLISLASVLGELDRRGRFDDRRVARIDERAGRAELRYQLAEARRQLRSSEAERNRLSEEVEKFPRGCALLMRARNEATERAGELAARGIQLALELAKVKTDEVEEIKQAQATMPMTPSACFSSQSRRLSQVGIVMTFRPARLPALLEETSGD